MKNKSFVKSFLIVVTVLAIAGLGFLTVQAQGLVETSNTNADIIAQKFINQINVISSVRIDDAIFSDATFRSLIDWSRPIPEEQKGRANPFAPLN
jgi:hypothetical protein